MDATKRIWLFFLSLNVTTLLTTTGKSESNCPEKATLSRAIQCCESLSGNQYLPTVQVHEDKISAGTFIGDGETWVNLKLNVNTEWKITGNRSIAHTFTKPGWKYRDSHCGIMKKRKSHITIVSCSARGLGAICEIQNCASCMNLGRLAHNCFSLKMRCYVVYCGLGNWFDARALCRRYGMDLAPPEENILRKFTKTPMPSIRASCKTTWVGLYRDTWDQIKALGNAHVTTPLWSPGQPNNTGSCAILRWSDDGYYLSSANCTETHEYICQVYQDTKEGILISAKDTNITTTRNFDISSDVYNSTSQVNWTENTTSPGQRGTFHTTTIVVSTTVSSIVILVVLAAMCWLWLLNRRKRRRSRSGKQNDIKEKGSEEEKTPCKSNEESKPKDTREDNTLTSTV